MKTQPLGRLRLVAYSAPSFVTSVAALPMALFVPAYYADDLGVPLAAVGAAIAFSRLLDVVTDPLIGALSDRLRLPLGRRKPWMLFGAPLFLLSLWQIFVPGDSASFTHLFIWSALLYLGFTMIDLPHKAWGAELSSDYDERSRITSWREAIGTAGQVMLLAALVWLAAQGIEDAAAQLHWIAVAIVFGLPVLLATCLSSVSEREPEGFAHERRSTLAGLAIVRRNPAFLRIEPYRVYRRLYSLRGWSHGTEEQVLAGGSGASGADGLRAPGPVRLGVGGDGLDLEQDRLHGGDAAQVGASG